MASFLVLIRSMDEGVAFCLLLIYLTNVVDVSAYVFGKFLGKRKLAPLVSSGKTIEGSLSAVLVILLAALVFHAVVLPDRPLWQVQALALMIGITAQLGDLVLSIFKRDVGIKDYSRLIPGQGGILDRFDSLVIATPLFYYCVQFLPPEA
jgi:phosphatidate cytidylyltransferase